MLSAYNYVQVAELGTAQAGLGQHAAHGMLQQRERLAGQQLFSRLAGLPARMKAIALVFLVRHLVAGKAHFLGIDHDNVVAGVHMRRERGFVFATNEHGDLAGHAADHLVLGVHQQPFLLRGGRIGHGCGVSRGCHFSGGVDGSVPFLGGAKVTAIFGKPTNDRGYRPLARTAATARWESHGPAPLQGGTIGPRGPWRWPGPAWFPLPGPGPVTNSIRGKYTGSFR